ncbi:hypothetical protein [Evansella clarkii]|uniref:hypothetical protein n=1 Tax=Evansella clarkii TaxID=79879 RepID=UPI000997BAA9|nr:hypothetical protein [Evansella clarkii]
MINPGNQTINNQAVGLRDRIQLDAVNELKTIINADDYSNEEKLRLVEARLDFKNTEMEKYHQDIEKHYAEEPAVEQLTLFSLSS